MTEQQILHLVFQKLADGTLPNADVAMLAYNTLKQDLAAAYFAGDVTIMDVNKVILQWEANITQVFA